MANPLIAIFLIVTSVTSEVVHKHCLLHVININGGSKVTAVMQCDD